MAILLRQVRFNESNRNNLAGGNNSKMRELSKKRAIGAMPIAGSYRAIDFH